MAGRPPSRCSWPPLCLAALLGLRARARWRRRYVRHWLLPYRADEATPDQVRRLLESWHQMTLRRWWQRLLSGQPSLSLELHAIPDDVGNRVRLMVACPDEPGLAEALDGRLVACYRDTRLVPGEGGPPWAMPGDRLKKRRSFTTRLETPERYDAVARRRARRHHVGRRRALHRPVRAHAGAGVVRPLRALAVPQRGAPARAGARQRRGRRPRRPLGGGAAGARGRPRAAAPAALLRRPARGGAELRHRASGGRARSAAGREPRTGSSSATSDCAGGCTGGASRGRWATRCRRGAAASSPPRSWPVSGTCRRRSSRGCGSSARRCRGCRPRPRSAA